MLKPISNTPAGIPIYTPQLEEGGNDYFGEIELTAASQSAIIVLPVVRGRAIVTFKNLGGNCFIQASASPVDEVKADGGTYFDILSSGGFYEMTSPFTALLCTNDGTIAQVRRIAVRYRTIR